MLSLTRDTPLAINNQVFLDSDCCCNRTAEAYAKSVELMPEDADAIFEDNYFDMIKGERRIKILEGNPTRIKLRSVYDIR